MAQRSYTNHAVPVGGGEEKKKQHSQETTQLSKSRPAPYLSPVSPYRLEQLILSPFTTGLEKRTRTAQHYHYQKVDHNRKENTS